MILNHRDRRTGITKEFIAIGDYVDLAARQTTLETLVAYGSGQATIYGDGEPLRVSALRRRPASSRRCACAGARPPADR